MAEPSGDRSPDEVAPDGARDDAPANEAEAAVLACNAAFYEAFNSKDLDAMERVWSSRADVTCVHPGWNPLEGRDAVMESWRSILGNQQQPKIVSAARRATVLDGTAIVSAREFVAGSPIATTNAFVHELGGWKMILHHTSLVVQGG